MAEQETKLKVGFEVDLAALDKGLADGEKRAGKFGATVEAQATSKTKALGNAAMTAGVGLRGLVSAAAIVSLASYGKAAVEAAVALDKLSRETGLSVEHVQQLTNGFKAAGISMDAGAALAEFAKKAAEAKLQSGELYEKLKLASPALAEQFARAKDTAEAMDVFANGLARVRGEQGKAALAQSAFGNSGRELVPILAQGAKGLEDLRAKGADFATQMDKDAIDAAKRFTRELGALSDEIQNKTLNSISDLTDALATGFNRARDIIKNFGADTASIRNLRLFGNVGDAEAVARQIEVVRKEVAELEAVVNRPASERGVVSDFFASLKGWTGEELEKARADLAALLKLQESLTAKVGEWKTTVTRGAGASGEIVIRGRVDFRGLDAVQQSRTALASALGDTAQQLELETAQAIENARRLLDERVLTEKQFAEIRANINASADAKVAENRRAAEEQMRGLRAQALAAEQDALGALGVEYELDLARYQDMLRKKEISEEQFQQAREDLNRVYSGRIRDQMERDHAELRAQFSQIESILANSLNELPWVFAKGKQSMNEFFADFAKQMAQAITMLLVIKPLMNSIFGPGGAVASSGLVTALGLGTKNAEGGDVRAGQATLVNERTGRKAEIFVPETSGRVMPGERASGASSGGSRGGTTIVYQIDARQSQIGVEQRIMAGLAALERQRPAPAAAVAGARQRFPTRR